MSDEKETKKNLEASDKQAADISEEKHTDNDSASRMTLPEPSTSQSSHQSGESPAVTTVVAGTTQAESIVTCTAAITRISEPERADINASPSRLSRFSAARASVSTLVKNLGILSPKRKIDSSETHQMSSLSAKGAASSLKDAVTDVMVGAASSLKGVVTGAATSVKGAIMPSRLSPERSSLVVSESECEPPSKVPKKEKEFYCAIPTFVDRETKPKASGNLTESTSLSSSDVASSLETDESPTEQSSPTEETHLLRTEKSPSKEKSPKKE